MGREVRKVPKFWTHPKDDEGEYIPLLNRDCLDDNPTLENICMPFWEPCLATHFMMYETCSEGTPLSPAFETKDELAKWLVDNSCSYFGNSTASLETWKSVIEGSSGAFLAKVE